MYIFMQITHNYDIFENYWPCVITELKGETSGQYVFQIMFLFFLATELC